MTVVDSSVPSGLRDEAREDPRLRAYHPQYWRDDVQLHINWQNSSRGWRWALWSRPDHAGDKEFSVRFSLNFALSEAERYRSWYPHDRVFFYAIPAMARKRRKPAEYEPCWVTQAPRSFWALVVTANMSIFEVKEGHIWDDREHAVVLSYEQFVSLREISAQHWVLPEEVPK